MTDTEKLLEKIQNSGLKKGYIAKQLDLSIHGLQKKIKNINQFKAMEIELLCNILNIKSLKEKEEIFFAENVDEKSTPEQ